MSDYDGIAEVDGAELARLRAEIERLNALVRLLDNNDAAPLLTEAAAFLDDLAKVFEPAGFGWYCARCRAMAKKLRGET